MDVGEEFAMELGRVSRWWRTRLDERLRETGLTQTRWIVLLQLSRAGPLSQRELAQRVGIEGPTLVRVLDNLERQNLVERRESVADRRVKEIHLSTAARPMIEKISMISAELRRELTERLPAADLQTAWEVLKMIGETLEIP